MSKLQWSRAWERSADRGRAMLGKIVHWIFLLGVILLGTAFRFHALGA